MKEIQAEADSGDKVLRWFDNEILDRDGALIARVRKQVYVRRKLNDPARKSVEGQLPTGA